MGGGGGGGMRRGGLEGTIPKLSHLGFQFLG